MDNNRERSAAIEIRSSDEGSLSAAHAGTIRFVTPLMHRRPLRSCLPKEALSLPRVLVSFAPNNRERGAAIESMPAHCCPSGSRLGSHRSSEGFVEDNLLLQLARSSGFLDETGVR